MRTKLLLLLLLAIPLHANELTFKFEVPGQAQRDKEVRWYSSIEAPRSITANGEYFWDKGFTCASRDLPFGTRVRITYHGRSACFRVNDRGPNHVEITLGGFIYFEDPDIGVLRGAKIEILGD